MRGRKPKPTFLKLVQGNPGKRKLNAAEPVAPPAIPVPPTWLSEAARLEWERSAPLLKDAGLLSNLDRNAFATYCQTYARLMEAEEQLRKFGLIVKSPTGHVRQSPFLAVVNKCVAQMALLGAEFGLTPSSRSRVKADVAGHVDELDAFLAKSPH